MSHSPQTGAQGCLGSVVIGHGAGGELWRGRAWPPSRVLSGLRRLQEGPRACPLDAHSCLAELGECESRPT